MNRRYRYRVGSLLVLAAVLSLGLGAWRWYCYGMVRHQSFDLGEQCELRILRSVRNYSDSGRKKFYYSIFQQDRRVRGPIEFAELYYPSWIEFALAQNSDNEVFVLYEKSWLVTLSTSELNSLSISDCLLRSRGHLAFRRNRASTAHSARLQPVSVGEAVSEVAVWKQSDVESLLGMIESLEVDGDSISVVAGEELAALPGLKRLGLSMVAQPVTENALWKLVELPAIESVYLSRSSVEQLRPGLVAEIGQAFPGVRLLYYDSDESYTTRELIENN